MTPLKICIAAEHASKRFGGEAFLPIHYFSLLRSRGIDTWLVVHSRTKPELQELFPQELNRMIFVPDLWIHKCLFRLSSCLPRRLSVATVGLASQLVTQLWQRRAVRKLVRKNGIDVVHQPIPISPRFPSALFGVGAPVVIGPMNGGMEYPPSLRRQEPLMVRFALAFLRKLVDVGNLLLPGKRKAAVLLVANARTKNALPSGIRGRVIELNENGIDVQLWQAASGTPMPTRPKFLFVGRLVDWKAVDIVIRALRQIPEADLDVVGDGPMLESWKRLAEEIGVGDRVRFLGARPQPYYAVRLRESTALVLPSLYESGGAVVLEAMASGRPVIATRWGGPTDYLDSSCGFLIEPTSYANLVAGFVERMRKLVDSPELVHAMGAAGFARAVREFGWEGRIDQIVNIYRDAAGHFDYPAESGMSDVSTIISGPPDCKQSA